MSDSRSSRTRPEKDEVLLNKAIDLYIAAERELQARRKLTGSFGGIIAAESKIKDWGKVP